jgi:hypothetical protein
MLRAAALGLIGGLALAGRLDPAGYVALLASALATVALALITTAILAARRRGHRRRRS